MSDWQQYFEAEIIRLLDSNEYQLREPHHFGHPFVSAYQLASAFERDNRELCRRLKKVVGEVGEGKDNLARYIAQQISAIKVNNPPDATIYKVQATEIASKLGNVLVSNIVMMGAYLAIKKLFSANLILDQLQAMLKGKKGDLFAINKKAFESGIQVIESTSR